MINPRTITTIEYAPCGLTAQGRWRPITYPHFRTPEAAVKALEEHKRLCEAHPSVFKGAEEYKIMKRTVIVTTGEWEEAEQ